MTKWIEYTGSDKQIEEILNSKNGFSYIRDTGDKDIKVYLSPLTKTYLIGLLSDCKQYLINNQHPYADLIKIWADTGCPVWVRSNNLCYEDNNSNVWERFGLYVTSTTKPNWNIPGAEYRLTPFED